MAGVAVTEVIKGVNYRYKTTKGLRPDRGVFRMWRVAVIIMRQMREMIGKRVAGGRC